MLHFIDKPKLVISKTLKETEETFQPYGFLRVHHSHLVNLQQVVRYVKSDGGFVEMSDGVQVPISRQRKEQILELLVKK